MRDFFLIGLFLGVATPHESHGKGRAVISLCIFGVLHWVTALFAAGPLMMRFDLPAEAAEQALKRFAAQSGLEVLFVTDTAANVKTNAVKGEYAPKEAIDRMLAGTPLVAIEDAKSGAMKISKTAHFNGAKPTPPARRARDSKKKNVAETPQTQEPMNRNKFLTRLLATLTSFVVPPATVDAQGVAANEAIADEAIALSPFEVRADQDKGYVATSTLAGTRLRTDLKDVAASVSVITKDFMEDVNGYNLEDLFVYTLGTEVSGMGGNFSGVSLGVDNPNYAEDINSPAPNTRLRGLASADETRDYFLTSIPLDAYNVDRVEVIRGPNGMLVGLGSPAGVVNSGLIKAGLTKRKTTFKQQIGSYGSARTVLDHNHVLIDGKLALRSALTYADTRYKIEDAYLRKKAGFLTGTYRPFRGTTIRANAEFGRQDFSKPEIRPPYDAITQWLELGKPAYDPVTKQVSLLGTPTRTLPVAGILDARNGVGARNADGTANTAVLSLGLGSVVNLGLIYSDPNSREAGLPGLPYDALMIRPQRATRNAAGQLVDASMRHVVWSAMYNNRMHIDQITTNFWKDYQITDPAIFDFYNHQLNGKTKYGWAEWEAFNVGIEQNFFDGRAGVEVVYDVQRFDHGSANPNPARFYTLYVDINTRFPNGDVNPNFGRPVYTATGNTEVSAIDRHAGRATGYYNLDLRKTGPDWLGAALGMHTFSAAYTEQTIFQESFRGQMLYTGIDYSAINSTGRTGGSRAFQRAHYIGPSLAGIDHIGDVRVQSPTEAQFPSSIVSVPSLIYVQPPAGSSTLGPWGVREVSLVTNGPEDVEGTVQQGNRTEEKYRSSVLVSSNHWFGGTIVSTLGWRKDEFGSSSAGAARINPVTGTLEKDWSQYYLKPGASGSEVSFNWGIVGHLPLRFRENLPFLSGLSISYNQSDNFRPAAQRYDVFDNPIDHQGGVVKEYGGRISLFNGKIDLRVVHHKTSALRATSPGLNSAVNNVGFTIKRVIDNNSTGINDDNPASLAAWNEWLNSPVAQGIIATWNYGFGTDADGRQTATWDSRPGVVVGTSDVVATGWEYEAVINPTPNWRIAVNAARNKAIADNSGAALQRMVAMLMPLYDGPAGSLTVVDAGIEFPLTRVLDAYIIDPMQRVTMNDGSPNHEVRQWRWNVISNYRFTEGRLKGWGVGGAVRWQDKVAIGAPVIFDEQLNEGVLDVMNPYYGPAETNYDAWLSYSRKIGKKVLWRAQLNVKNIGVGDELIPVQSQPDGSIGSWRIRQPMQWTLSNSFTF